MVVLYSFCAELHRPASNALIADIVPSDHRVAAYAFNRLMFNLAWAIGLAVGGFVAERSFTALFIVDAATSAIFGVISLVALPHGTRTSKAQEREVGGAFSAILRDRGFLLVLAGILAGSLIYAQAFSTFPLWVRDLGFGAAVYGFLQALNGLLVAALELPVTAIALRHPRTRMIALGILLTGLGGSSPCLPVDVGMAAALVVLTFGEMFASPSAAAFVADRAPSHLRGPTRARRGSRTASASPSARSPAPPCIRSRRRACGSRASVWAWWAPSWRSPAGRRPAPRSRPRGWLTRRPPQLVYIGSIYRPDISEREDEAT